MLASGAQNEHAGRRSSYIVVVFVSDVADGPLGIKVREWGSLRGRWALWLSGKFVCTAGCYAWEKGPFVIQCLAFPIVKMKCDRRSTHVVHALHRNGYSSVHDQR